MQTNVNHIKIVNNTVIKIRRQLASCQIVALVRGAGARLDLFPGFRRWGL